MKTNKKIASVFFLINFILFSFVGLSQNKKTDIEKLKSFTWTYQGLKDCQDIYSNNTIRHIAGDFVGVDKYYLSDSIDSIFVEKNVGSKSNGKYLHTIAMRDKNDKRPRPLSVFEIIVLTDDKLLLKYIKTGVVVELYSEKN